MSNLNCLQSNRQRFGVAVVAAVTCAVASSAPAAVVPFTPGNFLNYRVGSGATGSLTGACPVFIDEYTPAGVLVQSVAMPTTGATALTSTNSSTEGNISLSDNNQYLVIGGYRKDVGGAAANAPNNDAASVSPRVVGRIAMDGTFDTSTALTDAFNANNMRSVASDDGTHFWIGGSNGVRYVSSLGATTSTSINTANVRAEQVFGGVLYESTGAGTRGIRTYGGLPTSATTPTNIVVAATGRETIDSWQGMVLLDLSPDVAGVDTLYTTRLATSPTPQQGYIDKYVKDASGTWVAAGEAASVTDLFYLSGAYDPKTGNVVLYGSVFDNSTAAKIVKLTDTTGFTGSLDSTFVPTAIVTGVANEAFRGIAVVAPEPASAALLLLPVLSVAGRRRRERAIGRGS